jgi:hypothetical protein
MDFFLCTHFVGNAMVVLVIFSYEVYAMYLYLLTTFIFFFLRFVPWCFAIELNIHYLLKNEKCPTKHGRGFFLKNKSITIYLWFNICYTLIVILKSFVFIWCDKIYSHKTNVCHKVLKNENIFMKWLKWFLIFMKFVVFTRHCDFIWLE